MVVNALNILDEFESADGVFAFKQFERFGGYLGLNKRGHIHIGQIFEWLKKKLLLFLNWFAPDLCSILAFLSKFHKCTFFKINQNVG